MTAPTMPAGLAPEDIEQAIIVNRLVQPSLEALLGLHYASADLAAAFLTIEQLGHAGIDGEGLSPLRVLGRRHGEQWRRQLAPTICDQWGFCRRRATAGFGDSRAYFQELAAAIAPAMTEGASGDVSRDTMLLILVTVYLTRRSLDDLCNCHQPLETSKQGE